MDTGALFIAFLFIFVVFGLWRWPEARVPCGNMKKG